MVHEPEFFSKASASADGMVFITNVKTKQTTSRLSGGHKASVKVVAWDPQHLGMPLYQR